MYLKSLTVKGFKSFASATTMKLEPGITCVVGPNGSGKSNVVDAISWVLGEQGAKALRGGKMEDVIFAGGNGRAPLGRAEVTLTIDNTDGALPIDYTEVSITRRMFRSGESEYEINGDHCRLLDIQELLSDSGIGREMHVIVGQGQLDAVLHAKPEDRRAFIEEAAGVLKHRKRKEKALRKLDAMQANLNRVTDLTAELRRQLKPLGKQAEVARRAATIQSSLRDARLRLLADDLYTLRTTLDKEVADETAVRERRTEVEEQFAEITDRLQELEAQHAEDAPALQQAQDLWYQLSALQERFRSTAQLAAERHRHLSAPSADERPGRDPEQLESESKRVRAEEVALRDALAADQGHLGEAVAHRQELERQLAAAERAHVAAVKAIADRREGLAKLTGQVNAASARVATAAEEIERLSIAFDDAAERSAFAQSQVDEVSSQTSEADRDNAALDDAHQEAAEALEEANTELRRLTNAERTAEKEAATWKAREDALALGLERKDGGGALLARASEIPGVLGSLASMLTVTTGFEAALAAALGGLADAVAVSGVDEAAEAMRMLKIQDAGRASLVLGAGEAPNRLDIALPEGARWALDVVQCPAHIKPALTHILRDVVVVQDLPMAAALINRHPAVRAVTSEGDVLGVFTAAGGSTKAASFIEVKAAVDEAGRQRSAAEEMVAALADDLEEVRTLIAQRKAVVDTTASAKRAAEGERNAAARKLAELGAAARSAQAEAQRLLAAKDKAVAAREEDLERLTGLEERLAAAEAIPLDDEEPSTVERDRLAALVPQARQNEVEVRLAVRTAEERVSSIAGRADSLLRQANAERAAMERAVARQAARERGAQVAAAVEAGTRMILSRLNGALEEAARNRDALAVTRTAREAELTEIRSGAKRLGDELSRLTSEVHRDEVARAEQRMRLEQLETRAGEEFSIDVETLIGEYGPMVPVPVEDDDTEPFDRAIQEKRASKAERDLALLGKVNPLALEEFAALEERFKFLSDQLEDLKETRKDLLTVVKDVDDRILEVFASAFADTAKEFEVVFPVLFPGGEGRLVLTDPDDMLTTGIEVEARPPGKKIKRLSLLSGGERSLTAVALLVAIFKARPSPFYIMDEVEAALDDVNLGRLITLFRDLRERSQLIIITHQKRTMEVADALYGITMRNGVSEVISQKLGRSDDDADAA